MVYVRNIAIILILVVFTRVFISIVDKNKMPSLTYCLSGTSPHCGLISFKLAEHVPFMIRVCSAFVLKLCCIMSQNGQMYFRNLAPNTKRFLMGL